MYVHNFDPVFLDLGVVKIHYYGIIFALLFVFSYLLGGWFFEKKGLRSDKIDQIFMYCVLAVVIGARLGHVFFYNWEYFSAHPLEILFVWQGGLASHGALIGLIIAVFLLKKKSGIAVLRLGDLIALCGSLAVFMIRIANFINGEIVGRVTSVRWGVIFPCNDVVRGQCGDLPRHPSQLYESLVGLGLFIFFVFLLRRKKVYPDGFIAGLFLTLYFSIRFFLEFLKEYDGDVILAPWTNGQILSVPAALLGMTLLLIARKVRK